MGAASSRASRRGSAWGLADGSREAGAGQGGAGDEPPTAPGGGGSPWRLRAAPPSPRARTREDLHCAPPSDLPPGAPPDEPRNSKELKTLIFVFNNGLAQYKDEG